MAVLVPLASFWLKRVEGADGALSAGVANGKFHRHYGQAQNDQKQKVEQDKGRASVLSGYKGEAPHVPQSYGAASRRHDESDS